MSTVPDFQPLYKQVYNMLVRRIADGEWRPAQMLPSEQALAVELGVSQGTVRKALDALAAEKLVERRQGKGTYVAEHTQERALFQFFRLSRPDGDRVMPQSIDDVVKRRPARRIECKKLGLGDGSTVVEIRRTRLVEGTPVVSEKIVLPVDLFPDLDGRGPLPNTLYSLYQSDYGISVVAVEEQLKADSATKQDVKRLKLSLGAPLLHIDRVAVSIDGKRVEWRVSRCDTKNIVYSVLVR